MKPERASVASAILIALVMAAFISLPLCARAQQDCLINGHVFDAQNNQPIQGAFITFTNHQNSTVSNVNADGSGYYSMSLPYAPYTAHVEQPGYDPIDVDVNLNQPSLIQDFRLQPTASGGNMCQLEGYVRGNAPSSTSSSGPGTSVSVGAPEPIPGVHLVFTNTQTSMKSDANSDGSGHYSIILPYGSYTVRLEKSGYSTGNEAVDVNQPSAMRDFELQSNSGGSGNGNGDGSGFGNPSEGISGMMVTLGTIMVGVFSIVLVCVIIATIIIAVVIFVVRFIRG